MPGIAAGILTALAARVGVNLADRLTAPRPSFAAALDAARMRQATEAAGARGDLRDAEVDRLAASLLDLNISHDEAREIAAELQSLVESASSLGASEKRLEKALARFVEDVRDRYLLSPADTAALRRVANEAAPSRFA